MPSNCHGIGTLTPAVRSTRSRASRDGSVSSAAIQVSSVNSDRCTCSAPAN
nr:hypothetical protein [Stackebrandtia nassauensis]